MAKRSMSINPRRRRYPNLAAYILITGESQREIADAVGVSQAQISRILRGRKLPRPSLARKLSEHCRIPVESFMREFIG